MRIISSNLLPISALMIFMAAWQVFVVLSGISPVILPAPLDVIAAFDGRIKYLGGHAMLTLLEALAGLILGVVLGLAIAILFVANATMHRAVYPWVVAFKAIPLVALAPLTELWFPGVASKIVLATVITFFPVLVATVDGMNGISRASLDLMTTFKAKRWQVIWFVQLPNALPAIFSGIKISSTFAVIGAVVAEFVASNAGIGFVIKSSTFYLDTPLTFAAIMVAGALGISLFALVNVIAYVLIPWNREAVKVS